MSLTLSKRCLNIAPSVTLGIDTRAKALIAAGENVIGLAAGDIELAALDFRHQFNPPMEVEHPVPDGELAHQFLGGIQPGHRQPRLPAVGERLPNRVQQGGGGDAFIDVGQAQTGGRRKNFRILRSVCQQISPIHDLYS